MILISALLGIAADRLLTHLHEYRQYKLFFQYVAWARDRFSGPAWDHIGGVLLLVLPVWLLTGLLQHWTEDWIFGLVGLLFYIGVFIYCLGPRDLAVDVDTWCEVCESSDLELRKRAAGRLLDDDEPPEDPAECAREVTGAVLVGANDRLFAVLFWFVLLGPVGAVMYRSSSLLYQQRSGDEFGDSVAWLHAVMVWIPARMLALGYALSGHFDDALEGWRNAHRELPQGSEGSRQVILATGSGALGFGQEEELEGLVQSPVRAAMRLVWRTLVIWMVVIAVMTLAGLAS